MFQKVLVQVDCCAREHSEHTACGFVSVRVCLHPKRIRNKTASLTVCAGISRVGACARLGVLFLCLMVFLGRRFRGHLALER